ncbi:hypothetical protein [Streptomyces sp. NPDC058861]|uniref:hypothetical protein n=1 Tax=Streptomyces sp. NPDC058861 TaxID=3346653 RepID=UPI00367AB20D
MVGQHLNELHGVGVPHPLGPPAEPVEVDVDAFTGVYERAGSQIHVTSRDGRLRLRTEPTGILVGLAQPRTLDLTAVDATTFVGRADDDSMWDAVVFENRPGGRSYLHYSGRATPKTH